MNFELLWTGLLEKPYEQENLPVLYKKLFLVGRSGVGKTSTIDKLSGRGKQEVDNNNEIPYLARYSSEP